MPSKNVIKIDIPESYYHVYARGVAKSVIFKDNEDYSVYLNLLKRYLSDQPVKDPLGREYPHLAAKIELLAFCLMPNHVHLLVYQYDEGMMTQLMRGVMTSYSRYFNDKYHRTGPLFESRYKASRISHDVYLRHISRYIHLNPKQWRHWEWSSLPYYREHKAEWVKPQRILELFDSKKAYDTFVTDYEECKEKIDIYKHQLAGE
ncbi:MAG: transposase [Candidatus Saccharimonadales bacterium]